MIEYFAHYIDPKSPARSKLSVHLVAKAKSDVSTDQISKLIKTLSLDDESSRQAATDLQAKLTKAHHNEKEELEGMRSYLLHELQVDDEHIDAALEAWKKISKEHRSNGTTEKIEKNAPSPNGTTPIYIQDVRDFKSGLAASVGPRPVKDLSEYEDLDSKL